jgi:hypothetical protein
VRNAYVAESIVIQTYCSSGVTVNGKSVSTGSANTAAIDTGTTLIGAPTAAVNAIWGAVSGAVALNGTMSGFYAFRMYSFRLVSTPSLAVGLAVTRAKGVNKFQSADSFSLPYHQRVTRS